MVSSLRTRAAPARLLFASSRSAEAPTRTTGCHLRAVTTRSEMFYGDFIKICFYKSHVSFLKLFDEVLAVCVLEIIFSSVGFHAELLEYYICSSVSLGEKGQI